jgi:hypothetical protein
LSLSISGHVDAAASLDGGAPATTTATATATAMRPTGGKAKRKKSDKEKKEDKELEEAKKARSSTLLAAMDRVGQVKEDEDSKLCDYLCEVLLKLSPGDRTEAHMQLFQVVMNFSARQ